MRAVLLLATVALCARAAGAVEPLAIEGIRVGQSATGAHAVLARLVPDAKATEPTLFGVDISAPYAPRSRACRVDVVSRASSAGPIRNAYVYSWAGKIIEIDVEYESKKIETGFIEWRDQFASEHGAFVDDQVLPELLPSATATHRLVFESSAGRTIVDVERQLFGDSWVRAVRVIDGALGRNLAQCDRAASRNKAH